jgi:hypothetical protein
MNENISLSNLQKSLEEAWHFHGFHEKVLMNGVRDEYWAGWYAGYLFGKFGEFVQFAGLVSWLQNTESTNDNWTIEAAKNIHKNIR